MRIDTLSLPAALIIGLCSMSTGPLSAQTLTVLHSFGSSGGYATNADGISPNRLILAGDTLYGATFSGGSHGFGTIFSVKTNGTDFKTLYTFTGMKEGGQPPRALVLSGNVLYGVTDGGYGIIASHGTVFAINTDGTGFKTLYTFTGGSDGDNPECTLILNGGTLYGTTSKGGKGGNGGSGTVFKLNTNGTRFSIVYQFTQDTSVCCGGDIVQDGCNPTEGVILLGHTLCGTALQGGVKTPDQSMGNGTIFAINTDGTGFWPLHPFWKGVGSAGSYHFPFITNADGAYPRCALIASNNTLYGTATIGGDFAQGTVFSMRTDGTGFKNLHSFSPVDDTFATNSDGAIPTATLLLLGDTLYGTTLAGGTSSNGTIFAVNTAGTGFTNLYNFSPTFGDLSTNIDGANPYSGLVFSDNTFYGETRGGGSAGNGTIFALTMGPVSLPKLAIMASSRVITLSWPFTLPGFTLQSSTNLGLPTGWTPVFPAPVLVNGQNVFSNAISGSPRFYRLSR